jgi:hypothetical protein
MVRADYDAALSECTQLVPTAHPLHAQGCTAYVQASTGQLAPAYEALTRALAAAGAVAPELALWTRTRLAEMAIRLQRWPEAETHFREALQLGVTDQFLLGAYADFLLQQKRPAEVVTLLAAWERSDILLLRLALAGKALNDSRAKGWADQLRDRFAATSCSTGSSYPLAFNHASAGCAAAGSRAARAARSSTSASRGSFCFV